MVVVVNEEEEWVVVVVVIAEVEVEGPGAEVKAKGRWDGCIRLDDALVLTRSADWVAMVPVTRVRLQRG